MSAVRSMTGFAAADLVLEDGRSLSVRLKAVNGRHLELQVRLPASLEAAEHGLRALVKASVRRGHVELTVHMERPGPTGAMQVDEALLGTYLRAYREQAKRFGLDTPPDLNAMLRLPGVLSAAVAPADDLSGTQAAVAAVADALGRFQAVREAEGAALAGELRAGAERLEAMAEEAATLRREVGAGAVERLRVRLAELLRETPGAPEPAPERLLTEAALLVARGDVEEELVRLRTHVAQLHGLLDRGGEVGKPLEFLLQELGREANTMLAKTGGAAGKAGLRLTDLGLAMKVELERAREQVMNLE